MMKTTRRQIVVLFSILMSLPAVALEPIQAQVDQAIPHGRFNLGVGSHLTMKIPDGSNTGKTVDGLFLGRIVEPSGVFSKFMLLDIPATRIYLADREHLTMDDHYTFQPILKQYDQIGGTCTGYAIDHFLQQMYRSGFVGNGELREILSTEKGRTQLLVDSINEYYLESKHRFSILGVMKTFGKRFGFKCELKMFEDSSLATIYLLTKMNQGLPVMIGFNTGPDMVSSTYEITEYEKMSPMRDPRLWVPRKVGERKSGGHSVVAAAMFEVKNREKLLMLDSDWAEPRVWDVQNYLGDKTAIKEVEFYTCE